MSLDWNGRPDAGSLDDLIRPCEERWRNREAEGFGGLEVNDQLERGRLLNGQVTWLRPFCDPIDVLGGAPE